MHSKPIVSRLLLLQENGHNLIKCEGIGIVLHQQSNSGTDIMVSNRDSLQPNGNKSSIWNNLIHIHQLLSQILNFSEIGIHRITLCKGRVSSSLFKYATQASFLTRYKLAKLSLASLAVLHDLLCGIIALFTKSAI